MCTECDKAVFCKGMCKYHYYQSDHYKKISKDSRIRTRDLRNKRNRDYNWKTKIRAFNAYSNNNPKCACCGETEPHFLTIDHINGRKQFNHPEHFGGTKLYDWLHVNAYPQGFQVLCYNCNSCKGFYGKCWHKNNANHS